MKIFQTPEKMMTPWIDSKWFKEWEELAKASQDGRLPDGYWWYDEEKKKYVYTLNIRKYEN
jgi:hypothetical protein